MWRGKFQDEKGVRFNPEVGTADGEKDAFRFRPARAPILFEASGKRLFLLVGLELRQQERMADADLLAVRRIHDDVCRSLARLRADLLDAVLRDRQ